MPTLPIKTPRTRIALKSWPARTGFGGCDAVAGHECGAERVTHVVHLAISQPNAAW
jgi:hypothetical protein